MKNYYYLLLLVLVLSCNRHDEDCFPISDELFDWLPYQEGDTANIVIAGEPVSFIVSENDYDYQPDVPVFVSTICVNEWRMRMSDGFSSVSFSLTYNDFEQSDLWIKEEHFAFSRYGDGVKFMNRYASDPVFAVYTSKDTSSATIQTAIIQREKGIVAINAGN